VVAVVDFPFAPQIMRVERSPSYSQEKAVTAASGPRNTRKSRKTCFHQGKNDKNHQNRGHEAKVSLLKRYSLDFARNVVRFPCLRQPLADVIAVIAVDLLHLDTAGSMKD
jgi:hypothetical protein